MKKSVKFFRIPKNISEPELFKKMVVASVALHLGVLLFMGLKAAIFPNEPLDVDSAIRVDMVGLPDKIAELPPEKPAPAASQEKVTIKEPPKKAVVLKPKKTDLNKAIEEIKKQQEADQRKKAVEELANEMKAEQEKEKRQQAVSQLLKGNIVSPGSALHGLNKSQFNDYIGQIHAHIQQHWNLPEWLQNDSLRATVIVFLDYRGVVVKRILEKSSGDSRFDDYALRAVDSSSPFPQPPPKFVDLVRVDGIALRFPQ